jgi:hypothetical protein
VVDAWSAFFAEGDGWLPFFLVVDAWSSFFAEGDGWSSSFICSPYCTLCKEVTGVKKFFFINYLFPVQSVVIAGHIDF